MDVLKNKTTEQLALELKAMRDEKEVQSKTNFQLQFGVSRVIGGRKYQEDEYTCVDYLSKNKGPALFAVFDGHGTDDYSAVASNTLYKVILESDLFKAGQFSEAIKEGFAKEDRMLLQKMRGKRGGSTSTVAVIVGDELYIGHLGDSRAVLAVADTMHTHNIPASGIEEESEHVRPIRISRDHKPDDPEERKRIIAAGGLVLQGRVIGRDSAIDTSRALGDYDFKVPRNESRADFISSLPYVPEPILLSPKCKFIVLASDGLWNQMDEQSVVNTVNEMWSSGTSPNDIADSITEKLAGPEGYDNVTILIIFFIWDKSGWRVDDGLRDEVIISDHQSIIAQM